MFPPEEAKGLAGYLIAALEREFPTTRKVVAAIPEAQTGFKLGEKGKTAGAIAWHIVVSEAAFYQGILDGNFADHERPAAPATVAGILAWYDSHVPELLGNVKQLSGEALAKVIDFHGAFSLPAVMYLNVASFHSIHHRGYLAAYLRAMNAFVPSIYGGSADEPFRMPPAAG
jgi:uncharacterized damage-inducible protein DinB